MKNFLEVLENDIIYKNEYFFIIKDKYPVSPGHVLIISNLLKENFFELSQTEKENLSFTIDNAKELIEQKYNPDGYNIGMNCGEDAGQTVMHCHIHLIPRRKGDMDNPEGGVRGVIPSRQRYN